MRIFVTFLLSIHGLSSVARAQDSAPAGDVPLWTVSAHQVESPLMKYRLLPAEDELKNGNAAPILLRLPWDQLPFMNTVVPNIQGMLEIPLSDVDRVRQAGFGLSFDRFYGEMRRAAYRRTADWEYPLQERPLAEILLPDIQGARDFMRGLAVWIRAKIANGDLNEAREGILVGMAVARHYARTPFIIVQQVSVAHIGLMLDRVEELIQQPECPNLYWALTGLPAPILDLRPSYELDRVFLERSIDGLDHLDRERTAEEWQELATRVVRLLRESSGGPDDVAEATTASRQKLILAWARKDLPRLVPNLTDRIPAMADGELLVRWILARHTELADRVVCASALEFPQAFRILRQHDREILELGERWKLKGFYLQQRAAWGYATLRSRDRRIAALRVVEAVRDHASRHAGSVPESLRALTDLPAPNDPFTGLPFGYEPSADGTEFRLSAPPLEVLKLNEVETEPRHGFNWRIRVRKP